MVDIDEILRRCWQEAADKGVRDGIFVLSSMVEHFKEAPVGQVLYGHTVEVDPDLDGFVAYIREK